MKRALAAALLLALAAACSTGGDGEPAAVASATPTTADTPPTTGFDNDPEDGFRRAMESRFDQTGASAEAAITMAVDMCDMLDTTDSVSGGMADVGLALVFSEAEDGGLITEDDLGRILVIGAEYFCPDHRETVVDYISSRAT